MLKLKHDALLSTELAALAATFPNHLIIYTGSLSPSFAKRAAPIIGTLHNGTASTGGILAHYQLLTPGLITTLLVTLFVRAREYPKPAEERDSEEL